MKKNMGLMDKIIRLVISAVFVLLFVTNTVTGVFGYVLVGLAAVFALTSVVSFCPLYALFGMSTCPKEEK